MRIGRPPPLTPTDEERELKRGMPKMARLASP
jgi:hypothetical protein